MFMVSCLPVAASSKKVKSRPVGMQPHLDAIVVSAMFDYREEDRRHDISTLSVGK